PAAEVTAAAWDEMMDVNLKGAFFVAQAAGRIMLAQGSGRIVNMSSQAGSVGIRDHAVYCATKGGVEQFTRVLALEWGHRGVTVNAVAPTFIRTPGTAVSRCCSRIGDNRWIVAVGRKRWPWELSRMHLRSGDTAWPCCAGTAGP